MTRSIFDLEFSRSEFGVEKGVSGRRTIPNERIRFAQGSVGSFREDSENRHYDTQEAGEKTYYFKKRSKRWSTMRELSNSKGTHEFVVRNRSTEEVVGSYRAATPNEALYLMYIRSGYGQAVRIVDDRLVFDDEHVEGLCGGPDHWIVEPV